MAEADLVVEGFVGDVLRHQFTVGARWERGGKPLGNVIISVGGMSRSAAWNSLASTASNQHGAFSRRQANKAGLDAQHLRRAVASGRLRRPLSDVFAFSASPDSWMQRHKVADLAGGVSSLRSAAALHRLDSFERAGPLVDVSFERGRERKLPHMTVHRWQGLPQTDITEVDGIRCTSVARTLFELGAVCSRDEVEVALDSALRMGANPAWIEEVAERLRRPGPTGGGVLLDLMYDPSRGGALSESVLERVIERLLADERLPEPVRQHEVALPSGPRRLDLAYPEAKLGIEGHSRRHHFGARAGEADSDRDLELSAAGWEVVYVTWKLAHQPALLLDSVVAIHRQRCSLLGGV